MKPIRPKVKRTRKGYIVLESDIRDAMRVTRSNLSAAKYLGISYNTYKKWAESYIDSETGKTLLELHSAWDYETNTIKTYIPRGKSRKINKGRHKQKLEDVLDGKYEKYPLNHLKDRLFNAGLKPNCCESCGFNHARVIDGKIPLLLSQKDGNRENYDIDNLEISDYPEEFINKGFEIKKEKKIHISKQEAEQFYKVHETKPFYNELCSYLSSGPIVVMELTRENAVLENRKLMGATNPKDAEEGTIRKKYGISIDKNSVHGSDSVENAKIEIDFFFKD